jgi:aconitate hydratase
MDVDLTHEPLGTGADGAPVYLADIWPSEGDLRELTTTTVRSEMFDATYREVFDGDARWQAIDAPPSARFEWSDASTYIRLPPYLDGVTLDVPPIADVKDARVLALLGDSVTTDHISPAGVIRRGSPAAQWLDDHGVAPADYNSYGSRRGNHEVMVRGTFANNRLRNRLAPGTEGGVTVHLPDATQMSIYDAAMQYQRDGVALVVVAGKEYGAGSSRDWAAKGTALLGVRAVLAESFERIHRSNLIGMGVLPLQFAPGESAESLGLTGHEVFTIEGLAALPDHVEVRADQRSFRAEVRIDTPDEAAYFRHGGILPYVLRRYVGSR